MSRELLLFIVSSLVSNPDKIVINETENNKAIILELNVDKGDVGKVIGKEGRIIKIIRLLLNASASKNNKKIIVEVLG